MRVTRLALGALSVLVGSVGPSCRRGGGETESASGPPVDVVLVGCDAVAKDARCEVVEEQALRVVVDAKTALHVDARGTTEETCTPGPPIPPEASTNALLSVVLPPGARAVCVTARDARGITTKRVPLRPTCRPAWLLEANRLRKSGEPDRAAAIAREHEHDADQDGARAAALLGRLALARGATDEAARLLREAVTREAGGDRLSEEAEDRFALAYTLATHAGRSDEAEAVLATDMLDGYPEARARRAYYRAIAAYHAGDPRRGLERLDEALTRLAPLGLDEDTTNAEELKGLLLWRIGRAAEARALFVDLERRTGGATAPCTHATRLVNAARASMQAWQDAGRPPDTMFGPTEARQLAGQALAIGDARCPGGLRHGNASLALADASEALGDVPAARAHLGEARAATPHPARWFRVWWHQTMARVRMAETRAADASLELMQALALAASPQERWSLGRARAAALEAQKRDLDAAHAYEAAEEALDEIAGVVPFGEGQALAASIRSESARGLVALRMRRGEAGLALAAARRARARVLASMTLFGRAASLDGPARSRVEEALAALRRARTTLDEEAASDWEIPASGVAARDAQKREREREATSALDHALEAAGRTPTALPPLDPAELVVFLDVVGREVRILEAHRGLVSARTIAAPASLEGTDELFSRALLEPLAARLGSATRVRVLAAGEASRIEVHALRWRDAPLATTLPVVHGIDLPAVEPRVRKGALVVADPTGDLPGARAESDRVVVALRAAGEDVKLLFQAQADAPHVRPALEGVRFFHYAGHAKAGGHDGRDAALVLAEHTSLTVGDVLALRSAPSVVILSACEAARAEDVSVASLGLAHAFVVAGSTAVVAPSRRVPDDFAVTWSAALQAQLGVTGEVAAAFTAALRERVPAGDWAAFRVVVR